MEGMHTKSLRVPHFPVCNTSGFRKTRHQLKTMTVLMTEAGVRITFLFSNLQQSENHHDSKIYSHCRG